ncbi:hypothetical protein U1872_06255 [Sphingomonas sp. RB3P16]|uniref:hypothetical protein n=1 Tax=Parasphingomonas frigoris TaxID=3096163 RepID=UPI002FC6229D
MQTDFDFRRTVTTLTFCGLGVGLTLLLGAMTVIIRNTPRLVFHIALGVEGLLLVVVTGLAMTVALRQISAKFGGGTFDAQGGADPDPATPAVVTTTTTTLESKQ